MILTINFITSLKLLSYTIVIPLLVMSIILILGYNEVTIEFVIYMFLPYFILFILPTLVLHFNYYQLTKNKIIEITAAGIVIESKNKMISYDLESIREISFVMTSSKIKNSAIPFFLFDNYYFARLRFQDGEQIILTCLLDTKIDEILTSNFNNVKVYKESTLYPIALV